MPTTPNLGLFVVDPTDTETAVLDWVRAMGSTDATSNMMILDQAAQGIIKSVYFSAEYGCWIAVHENGALSALAGPDLKTNEWSCVRDTFDHYTPGSFGEQCSPAWRMSGTYTSGNHDIIEEESGEKYLRLMCGKNEHSVVILNAQVYGEHTVEFDYMPTRPGDVVPRKTLTDFLEVRLFTTQFYHPEIDSSSKPDPREHIRARINIKGQHYLYATSLQDGAADIRSSPGVVDADGADYCLLPYVWYRVKISVGAGKITMKIWERDTMTEPVDDSAFGVTSLELPYLTPEFLSASHDLRFYFGKMAGDPPLADGWQMGLDNVRVYRDMTPELMTLRGVHVGSGDMPPSCYIQIDPDGDVLTQDELVRAVLESLPAAKGVAY